MNTASPSSRYPSITLVGHVFAPIGMGEHVRCTFRSLGRAAVRARVMDIYGLSQPESGHLREFSPHTTVEFSDINIFHINGDEVQQALAHVTYNTPLTGYSIVYPAWELARYPAEWAAQLDRFDEIWAPSAFIADTLRGACSKPVHHMPLGTEVQLDHFASRRWFGIPDQDFCFLFFFDIKSYIQRKNPQAVLQAFAKLLQQRPFARTRLVVKVNGFDASQPNHAEFLRSLEALGSRIKMITDVLDDDQVKNLVRCCDCFVSLHRSEGFGRGMAEAMYLGKPVIATAYSGNLDFMTRDVSLLVDYRLIPVGEGDYPHWQAQVWADPDISRAVNDMLWVLDHPEEARQLGEKARLHMLTQFSFRPTGVRYRQRIEEIWASH